MFHSTLPQHEDNKLTLYLLSTTVLGWSTIPAEVEVGEIGGAPTSHSLVQPCDEHCLRHGLSVQRLRRGPRGRKSLMNFTLWCTVGIDPNEPESS